MADLEDFKIPMDANFSDIIVPTIDTIRSTFVLELLLGAQKTVGNCFLVYMQQMCGLGKPKIYYTRFPVTTPRWRDSLVVSVLD